MPPRKKRVDPAKSRAARRSKHLGYSWESSVVKLLQKFYWPKARRNGTLYGGEDRGDIGEVPFVLQCKNLEQLGPKKLAEIMDQTEQQAKHAGLSRWAIVLKRRGFKTEKGFFIIPIEHGIEYMRLWEKHNESGDDDPPRR